MGGSRFEESRPARLRGGAERAAPALLDDKLTLRGLHCKVLIQG